MTTNDQQPPKRGLGRGLNALFDDEESNYTAPTAAVVEKISEGKSAAVQNNPGTGRTLLMVDQLFPGTFQPRYDFDEKALEALSQSIKQHGVLQPILVRAEIKDFKPTGRYEIIAGERRWRASQLAQLHEVPVVIHEFSDEEALQVALVENLQRADLNPIEEAKGYYRLMTEFKYSQDELGEILGKSRSHVANTIRLLNLPDSVQNFVREGKITSGHARALVTAHDSKSLAQKIIDKGLSVRQTEKMVAEQLGRAPKAGSKAASGAGDSGVRMHAKDADTLALEKELAHAIGMNVSIDTPDGHQGKVTISFKSLDQLDDVIKRLMTSPTNRLLG